MHWKYILKIYWKHFQLRSHPCEGTVKYLFIILVRKIVFAIRELGKKRKESPLIIAPRGQQTTWVSASRRNLPLHLPPCCHGGSIVYMCIVWHGILLEIKYYFDYTLLHLSPYGHYTCHHTAMVAVLCICNMYVMNT